MNDLSDPDLAAKEIWYETHGCTHAHCPFECDHPQPFLHEGKLYCGCCYFASKPPILTEMLPCTPDICD